MQLDVSIIDDSRMALQSLRGALIELYASVGADPSSPQETSRRFGINRNLTWKVARVIGSTDPFASLNHLPGQQGIDLLIRAFERAGAPNDAIASLQHAMERFNGVVKLHADDRDQFELTLESMGLFERERSLESGRELAFRGNSMIWGVQTRTRLMVALLAPTPGSAREVDVVQLSGLIGFRRLRPTAHWRLARAQVHDDKGATLVPKGPEPFEPSNGIAHAPLLVPEFCSPNMPAIEAVPGPEGLELLLPGGPVGSTGAFDCVVGMIARRLPRFRAANHESGSSAAAISLPTENLIQDLIIHRSVEVQDLDVSVFGFPHGGLDSPAAQGNKNVLPFALEPEEIAGSPPAVATPLAPRYSNMINRVYQRMGWTPNEFRGWRVQFSFPPMSSRVVLRWMLPPEQK